MNSKTIFSGIKWAGIQFVLDTIFRFSIKLILAKQLIPSAFGLVGMCTVFILVAEAASELGMSAALIQRKDDGEVKKMYSTAFWSGLGWGVLLYVLISFVIGPFAASFYNEPLLVKLIPILSLGIFLKPLGLIHIVILTRKMDFKKISKIYNSSALVAGFIAILSAYLGMGVWSIVINNVLAIGLTIPLLYYNVSWRPKLVWNKSHFKSIFGFGVYSTGTSIFSTLTYNIDNLIIGKMLGSSLLGAYSLSFSLTEQLRQMISAVLNKVMYPVFSQSQDDKVKLKSYFIKIITFNALLIYPLMAYLLFFSEDLILGFFGDKWEKAIMPLKILSVAMMVHLLVNSFTSLIRAIGKPKLEMQIIISLTLFVLIPGLYFGIYYFGLEGAAYAILLNKIMLMLIGLFVLKNEIGLSIISVFIAVKNAVAGVVASILIILLLSYVFSLTNIFILTSVFFISYAIIIYFLEKPMIINLKTKFL